MKRYTITINDKQVAQFNQMTEVAKYLGCARQYIYLKLSKSTDNTFTLKKNNIEINDLLKND
jgi:DNA-binding phage protein